MREERGRVGSNHGGRKESKHGGRKGKCRREERRVGITKEGNREKGG